MTQKTPELCWEACGRMMWLWRHKQIGTYNKKAGKFLSINTGLDDPGMEAFYKGLGLRSLANAKGKNIRHALTWSPVIFTDVEKTQGHVLVAAGFSNGQYTVVNPCEDETMTFGVSPQNFSSSCVAGLVVRPASNVDRPLGKYIWYW